jgi:lipoprotein-releasing system permease protein
MSAIGFVSKQFSTGRGMPRSVRTMRAVAGIGIAIAVAALVVAISIGRGFEREYEHALFDFNAHLVLMGAGELGDPQAATEALATFRTSARADAALERRAHPFLPWLRMLRSWYDAAAEAHARVATAIGDRSLLRRAWAVTGPAAWTRILPASARSCVRSLLAAEAQGVVATTPFLYREALAIGGGAIRGVIVKGVDPATMGDVNRMAVTPFDEGTTLPQLFTPSSSRAIPVILGKALAEALGVATSRQPVRLLVPTGGPHRDPRKDFQEIVPVGTFESGIHDYDADFLLMRLDDARRLFRAGPTTASGIEIRLEDPKLAALTSKAIEERLGPAYRAITWEELNGDLLAAVRLERLVTTLIMAIMLLVAALNIVATLVLTSLRRLPQIALLKALGLPDRDVERLFIRMGMSVGGRAIAAGLTVGIAVAWAVGRFHLVRLPAEIYLIESLPIDISGVICGALALFCAAVVFCTSKLAARRLAAIEPAHGLARAR